VPVAATEAANQATALGLDPTDPTEVQVRYLMPEPTPSSPCPQRGLGCIAEVRVQYQFQAITPVIGSIIGPITLSSVTQIPIENTKP
jgi:hypothetical protein